MQDLRQLQVWQKAHPLSLKADALTGVFPKSESLIGKWDRHPACLRAGFQPASVADKNTGWKPAVGQAGSLSRYPAVSSQKGS